MKHQQPDRVLFLKLPLYIDLLPTNLLQYWQTFCRLSAYWDVFVVWMPIVCYVKFEQMDKFCGWFLTQPGGFALLLSPAGHDPAHAHPAQERAWWHATACSPPWCAGWSRKRLNFQTNSDEPPATHRNTQIAAGQQQTVKWGCKLLHIQLSHPIGDIPVEHQTGTLCCLLWAVQHQTKSSINDFAPVNRRQL